MSTPDLKPRDLVQWGDNVFRILAVHPTAKVNVLAIAVDDPSRYVIDVPAKFTKLRDGRPSDVLVGDAVILDDGDDLGITHARIVELGAETAFIEVRGYRGDHERKVYRAKLRTISRPVGVGDRLHLFESPASNIYEAATVCGADTDPWSVRVEFDDRPGVAHELLDVAGLDRWEHADGTPIEPRETDGKVARLRIHTARRRVDPGQHGTLTADALRAYVHANKVMGVTVDAVLVDAIGLERLARAVHATDPAVVAHAMQRSEGKYEPEKPTEEEGRLPALHRALDVSFDRDEPKGSRAGAFDRVAEIVAALARIGARSGH